MITYDDTDLNVNQTEQKEGQPLTTAIPNKGFSGFRAASPASSFVLVDSYVLRNPLLGIAADVDGNPMATVRTSTDSHKTNEFMVKIHNFGTEKL